MIDIVKNSLPVKVYNFTEAKSVNEDLSKGTVDKQNALSQDTGTDLSVKPKKEQTQKNDTTDQSKRSNFNDLAKKIQSALGEDNLSIEFSLDKDSKQMIMKIIDEKTNVIVQQIPPELALKIARIVANYMESGNITDAKV
jgi:flagellar protein FlaG